MSEFPNKRFNDEIDELVCSLTMQYLKLQFIGPAAVNEVHAEIRHLLEGYGDKRYNEGMDAGISLQKMAGE